MFLVVTNTREHLLRYFALLRLTEALPLTMAESLPTLSREQADLLLRQIQAAFGTSRAGDRVGSGAAIDNASAGAIRRQNVGTMSDRGSGKAHTAAVSRPGGGVGKAAATDGRGTYCGKAIEWAPKDKPSMHS